MYCSPSSCCKPVWQLHKVFTPRKRERPREREGGGGDAGRDESRQVLKIKAMKVGCSVQICLTVIFLDGNFESVCGQIDSTHCGTTETGSE